MKTVPIMPRKMMQRPKMIWNRIPMALMSKGLNDDRSMLDGRTSRTFCLVNFGESLSLVAESKSRRVHNG